MKNDILKDLLIELENAYNQMKSNKDKRLIKPIINKIKEVLDDDK